MNLIWLAMNLFTEQFTIDTRGTKEGIIGSLASNIETRDCYLGSNDLVTKDYIGTIDEYRFTMMSPSYNRSVRHPGISGEVYDSDKGVSVLVKIKWAPFDIWTISTLFVALAFFLTQIIITIVDTRAFDVDWAGSFSPIVIFAIGYLVFVKYRIKRIKDDIKRIVLASDYREGY